jgi:hypothetical protein
MSWNCNFCQCYNLPEAVGYFLEFLEVLKPLVFQTIFHLYKSHFCHWVGKPFFDKGRFIT